MDIQELPTDFDSYVYTSIDDAVAEVRRRYADVALKQKVADYIGLDTLAKIPYLLHEPVGISFRHVATPNRENERFIDFTSHNSLRPVFFEYFDDKFTSNNAAKYMLGKCHVHHGLGKNGGEKIEHHTIIDFNTYNGKLIRDVHTLTGESLVEYHHRMFLKAHPGFEPSLFDASLVFADWGDMAATYYEKFLALFICFGVLVETFVPTDTTERPFIENIFLPAFKKAEDTFGYKPIIVRLLSSAEAEDPRWYYYEPERFLKQDTV